MINKTPPVGSLVRCVKELHGPVSGILFEEGATALVCYSGQKVFKVLLWDGRKSGYFPVPSTVWELVKKVGDEEA